MSLYYLTAGFISSVINGVEVAEKHHHSVIPKPSHSQCAAGWLWESAENIRASTFWLPAPVFHGIPIASHPCTVGILLSSDKFTNFTPKQVYGRSP